MPSKTAEYEPTGAVGEPAGARFLATALLRFQRLSQRKHIEKPRYIHRNPVKRGLVASPELWRWSSYRYYRLGEKGAVKVGE